MKDHGRSNRSRVHTPLKGLCDEPGERPKGNVGRRSRGYDKRRVRIRPIIPFALPQPAWFRVVDALYKLDKKD